MTMTIWQGALTIVTVVLGTMCTRFLPFLVFPESKQPPRVIEYFGRVLPYAMTGLLVVQHPDSDRFTRPSGTHRLHRHRAAARLETQYAAFNRRRHDRIHATGAAGVLRLGSASPSLISPSGRLRRPPPSVREVLNAAKRR